MPILSRWRAEVTRRLLMTADAVGGVWTYAVDLAKGLTAHGIETTLAVLGPKPDAAQLAQLARCPGVCVIPTGLPLDWLSDAEGTRLAARQTAALARRCGADLVQLNSPALAALADWPVPVVGVAHGCVNTWWQAVRPGEPLAEDLRWHAAAMAEGLRACTRVVAPTAAFAAAVRRVYQLPEPPAVVHNGCAWAVGAQSTTLEPAAFTAGRLWDEAKNTPVLEAAASQLSCPFEAAGPIAGPQGQSVGLKSLRALGTLASPAMTERLRRRPVFVSAAVFEPFGLAVLEAAASGCALVLSDIPTFRELWDGAARFVPPHDAAGFARAVDTLLANPGLRLESGERARHRAAGYSVPRMTVAMAGEYRAALRRCAGPKEAAA